MDVMKKTVEGWIKQDKEMEDYNLECAIEWIQKVPQYKDDERCRFIALAIDNLKGAQFAIQRRITLLETLKLMDMEK